jgi:hypothetical protein
MTKIGTFHTPPENQGQIVEVSYTVIDGIVIRRTFDRSERSTEYATSKARANDDGDYWNGEPENNRWRQVTAQELNCKFGAEWGIEF